MQPRIVYTSKCLFTVLIAGLLCTCDSARSDQRPADDKVEMVSDAQQAVDAASNISLTPSPNPPAPGFNLAASDAAAVKLVDSIVKYHGGRETYDNARYFTWNFLGKRTLTWDKLGKRARIDVPNENMVYLLNYGTKPLSGKIRVKGDEIKDATELAQGLKKANSMLINDSYWLVHQFKLLDDGVTLKYLPEVITDPLGGRPCYVLDQTFEGVGDTPGNRYRLYIDKVTYRINTWEFYREASDDEFALQTPWKGYIPYRGLLLSGDRGERFQLSDIGVPEKVRETLFTEF